MEGMDDSTPMSKQLEEEARRTAAATGSTAGGAAAASSANSSVSNLLQPSSFSSSLSSHPFMSQHNARSPHGARPATASAFSNAAAPAFSLASGSAAAPAASFSLHVPTFGAASASPGPRSPGPAGSKKRSSEQFYEQHQTDRDSLPSLQAKHARADSDDDLEAGRGRAGLSPGDMDEEGE